MASGSVNISLFFDIEGLTVKTQGRRLLGLKRGENRISFEDYEISRIMMREETFVILATKQRKKWAILFLYDLSKVVKVSDIERYEFVTLIPSKDGKLKDYFKLENDKEVRYLEISTLKDSGCLDVNGEKFLDYQQREICDSE